MKKRPPFPAVHRALALLLPLVVTTLASADNWAPHLTVTTLWQDNATNANLSSDRMGALQTHADLLASRRYALGPDDSLHLGIRAAAEWWPRFQNLATAAGGLRAEWRHKFGLGALAPVFAVELAADSLLADERGRRGTFTAATVTLRKRFGDAWRAALTQEFSDHAARAAVHDRSAAQTTLELGYDLDAANGFTFSILWRDGDVVSYATPPRPDLVALARVREPNDTFRRPFTVYSIDARTLGAKAGFVRTLNPSSAVLLGYEWRETERHALRYVNRIVSLAFVHQF